MTSMKMDPLRVAALLAYLLSWVVLAIAAIAGALPRLRRDSSVSSAPTMPGIIGTLLQGAALFVIVVPVAEGPLRPWRIELLAVLLLSPLAAWLFVWAQRSTARPNAGHTLVTAGAYAWLRHPIYLAFFLLLLATGCVVSAGLRLLIASACYIVGTELRVTSEEAELERKFPAGYAHYRQQTRWRYLPGLR